MSQTAKSSVSVSFNKEWHEAHPMPKHTTFEQRLHWHREHQAHCNCRPGFPKALLMEMKKRGVKP